MWRLRSRIGGDKGQADAIPLDPGDPARMHDRWILRHHEAKMLRDEDGVIDVDRRPLARDISHHAWNDGTARRNIGGLVDLRSRIFSFLFHLVSPRTDSGL